MQIIRNLCDLNSSQPCAATIGNFDGIHLGHKKVLQQVIDRAKERALPSTLILFEPQPKEYFLTEYAPARLTKFREKIEILKQIGIERVVCLRFNSQFAKVSAKDFIEKILIEKLHIDYLLVGEDFRFGNQRQGDVDLLKKAAQKHNFTIETTADIKQDYQRISSSRIRHALKHGDVTLAAKLLGRSYTMLGHVVHGDKRGRELGYPTANIPISRIVSPLRGIFVVNVKLKDQILPGVASIGNRPTVDGGKFILEVFIFDFDQDIYGEFLQVEFLKKLRDEKRFDDLQSLVQQMHEDAKQAREFFTK